MASKKPSPPKRAASKKPAEPAPKVEPKSSGFLNRRSKIAPNDEPAPRPSKPKKVGRPPKKAADRRVHTLGIRVTAEEKLAVEEAASKAGQTLSEFVLDAVGLSRSAKTP